uniref:Uncharacterized protein n=1 Tax=Euplotes harpa TaxID=151035 RepID=A0A7S3IZ90_9SPIT|mmetsp:Transcript_10478/g.11756  ORF Transcript_10478/g.11756 Transcript_10478/m.11756 type:complete len:123 (+) Transcript_10478:305-673(+)
MIKNPLQFKKIANCMLSPSVLANHRWRWCTNENSILKYTAFSPDIKPDEANEPYIKTKSPAHVVENNKLKLIAKDLGVAYEDDFITDERLATARSAKLLQFERVKPITKYYPYIRPVKFKGK